MLPIGISKPNKESVCLVGNFIPDFVLFKSDQVAETPPIGIMLVHILKELGK